VTLQIQAIIAAVLLVGGLGGGFYLGTLRGKAQVSQMQASAFQKLAEAYAKQQSENELKAKQLEKENEDLQTSAVKYPDVGVCHYTPAAVPTNHSGQVVHSSSGLVQANPQPVPESGAVSEDPSPIVFGLADAADKLAARCRAL
jgi:hypothetical protein